MHRNVVEVEHDIVHFFFCFLFTCVENVVIISMKKMVKISGRGQGFSQVTNASLPSTINYIFTFIVYSLTFFSLNLALGVHHKIFTFGSMRKRGT